MADRISESQFQRLIVSNRKVVVFRNRAAGRVCDECCEPFSQKEVIIKEAFPGKKDSGTPPELRYFHLVCYERLYGNLDILN